MSYGNQHGQQNRKCEKCGEELDETVVGYVCPECSGTATPGIRINETTEKMAVSVKTISGETISIGIAKSGTVYDLKLKIEKRVSVAPAQQTLIYGRKELKDDDKLSYYGIKHDETVQLVLRLRGGTMY